MTDDRSKCRSRVEQFGGGSTAYSLGAPLLGAGHGLNNAYGVLQDIGCGAAARPMVSGGQPGLPGMSGGRRRRRRGKGKTRRHQRGGRYGFDLSPQMNSTGFQPNQYAAVVGMRGETCTPFTRNGGQMGGGAMLSPAPIAYPPTIMSGSYQAAMEVPKTVYENVIPPGQSGPNTYMLQQPLGAAQISASCLKTGGRRRSKKHSKKHSKKGRKSRRSTRK